VDVSAGTAEVLAAPVTEGTRHEAVAILSAVFANVAIARAYPELAGLTVAREFSPEAKQFVLAFGEWVEAKPASIPLFHNISSVRYG